jgi:hypothetical protein
LTLNFPCAIKSMATGYPMTEQKLICYTLDLEHDYAGLAPSEEYEAFGHAEIRERLPEIVRSYGLKLTVFATGKVLAEQKETVEFLQGLGAEIELHGHDHIIYQPDLVRELQKGTEAYRNCFGRDPLGYRSPGGVISPLLLKSLAAEGIRYDSSIIPSYRWGMYKNLKSPLHPFRDPEASILELPISVVPRVRVPIATSYIRLFGLATFKSLCALFGTPSPAIYLFHFVDLVPTPMRKKLSPFWRGIYAKGRKKGLQVFAGSVKHFHDRGFQPAYMSQLYSLYSQVPESPPENKGPVKQGS